MSGVLSKSGAPGQDARLLLEDGSPDGAASRAYFAMFHAARAALERAEAGAGTARRHASVIARFSQIMVRGHGFERALGRAFNVAFDQRLIADYDSRSISSADARVLVDDMTAFLDAVSEFLSRPAP